MGQDDLRGRALAKSKDGLPLTPQETKEMQQVGREHQTMRGYQTDALARGHVRTNKRRSMVSPGNKRVSKR